VRRTGRRSRSRSGVGVVDLHRDVGNSLVVESEGSHVDLSGFERTVFKLESNLRVIINGSEKVLIGGDNELGLTVVGVFRLVDDVG
jgi:hypothetical protein